MISFFFFLGVGHEFHLEFLYLVARQSKERTALPMVLHRIILCLLTRRSKERTQSHMVPQWMVYFLNLLTRWSKERTQSHMVPNWMVNFIPMRQLMECVNMQRE
jgi:quinol-cytochrome oxidoreductase complex cytochrome b subunit